jgi:microcystin-dependent protein
MTYVIENPNLFSTTNAGKKELDQSFVEALNRDNDLLEKIGQVESEGIAGTQERDNIGKFVSTDGNEVIWTKATSEYFNDNSIPGIKLTAGSLNQRVMGNSCIGEQQVIDRSLTLQKMAAVPNRNSVVVAGNDRFLESVTTETPGLPLVSRQNNNPNFQKIGEAAILDDSITSGMLKTDSVLNSKIRNGEITIEKLAESLKAFITEKTGFIKLWSGQALPEGGYYWCDGSTKSRADDPALFAVIGTRFGVGDGATTFNLPDFRGRTFVGIGQDNSTGGRVTADSFDRLELGGVGGEEKHTLTVNEIPSHSHVNNYGYQEDPIYSSTSGEHGLGNKVSVSTENAGGGLPHNNIQPSMFCYVVIKR